MMSREQEAEWQRKLSVIRIGMRRAKKTDVVTDIVLVGGPRQLVCWFRCKLGSKTFTMDRPDRMPGWNPFAGGSGTGQRMRRYLYAVREIEGVPFYVGDFVAMDKW
jgi:hypothetical protein